MLLSWFSSDVPRNFEDGSMGMNGGTSSGLSSGRQNSLMQPFVAAVFVSNQFIRFSFFIGQSANGMCTHGYSSPYDLCMVITATASISEGTVMLCVRPVSSHHFIKLCNDAGLWAQ